MNNTYAVTTRLGGAAQAVGGAATALVTGPMTLAGAAACPETFGAGCAVAVFGAVGFGWSVDQMKAGGTTTWTGRDTATVGGKVASYLFGVSPAAGELINGVVGLSPMAVEAALAKNLIKIPAKVSKVEAGTNAAGATK